MGVKQTLIGHAAVSAYDPKRRKFRCDPPRLACTAALHRAQKSVMEFLATKFNLLREARRISAMATLKPEEEEVLTFDVFDEALEIAGSDRTHLSVNLCR